MSGVLHFRDAGGSELQLTLAGYEVPESNDWWDANWLNVRVSVTTSEGSWSGVDPCLTTREVGDLISWLEASAGRQEVDRLDFTEPNLQFDLVYRGEDAVVIRVAFDAELLPPWLTSSLAEEPFGLDFELHPRAILAAVGELRRGLAEYPERATGTR